MGNNEYGQLGLGELKGRQGDTNDRLTPTILPDIKGKSISCGNDHCNYRFR